MAEAEIVAEQVDAESDEGRITVVMGSPEHHVDGLELMPSKGEMILLADADSEHPALRAHAETIGERGR